MKIKNTKAWEIISFVASITTVIAALISIYLYIQKPEIKKQLKSFINKENISRIDHTESDTTTQTSNSYLDIMSYFTATGWMGDGEFGYKYIQLNEAWRENPHSKPVCIKISYKVGSSGWAGIYWQNKPNNWGDRPGLNLSNSGYRKITFWARGEKGVEIVEFRAGGINSIDKKYNDSFSVTTGKIFLKKEWKMYIIDLKDKDLSSVIGGFCWISTISLNPKELVFYLDDVKYE